MTDYELYGRTDLDPDEILRRAYAGEISDPYSFFDTRTGEMTSTPGWSAGEYETARDAIQPTTSGTPSIGNLLKLLGLGGNTGLGGAGLLGLLAALAASKERRPAYGGGTRMGMPAPVVPQRMAAQGGLMKAYRQGGHVNMEDGGFVMTKRAVDGAGGPRGLAQMLPGARPIRGPGTGTSDSIPATINGPRGQTPARVSNGEAYVPRRTVQNAGGAQQLYDLMNNLQRRA
jgi:hypothetical protein